MSLIVVAGGGTPPPPPPPPPQPVVRPTVQLALTGTDGAVWDLVNGPVRAASGTNLFNTVPLTHRWKTTPLRDGAGWVGVKAEQRDITLPVFINAPDWRTFRDLESAFFQSLAPDEDVTVTVTTPDSGSRNLALRFVSDGNPTDDTDPLLLARKLYPLALLSGWPYWRGQDVKVTFQQETPQDFFVSTVGSTLFFISSSASFQAAAVTNVGDVPSWPIYIVQGPATTWAAGVGDSIVTSSRGLSASESVTIDPEHLLVTNQDGDRVWEWLDERQFAPIPPGEDIPLTIDITGYTSQSAVSVTLPTWCRRPW